MDFLKSQRNQSSTRENYYRIWKSFNKFFISLDKKLTTWEERLTLFIRHLINSNRQSATIKSYISAIKAVLLENNIKIKEDSFLLSLLIRACHLCSDKVKQRFPIQIALLEAIVREIQEKFESKHQLYLSKLYQAMFLSAYYGLLRISEITKGSHPILAPNIHLGQNKKK